MAGRRHVPRLQALTGLRDDNLGKTTIAPLEGKAEALAPRKC